MERTGHLQISKPARRLVLAGLLLAATAFVGARSFASDAKVIAAPDVDVQPPTGRASEVAVLAGGCFWGVQGVFQHVEGVTNAVSGYSGGSESQAKYDLVSAGVTKHAEAVRITFDPRKISYGQILQIYFSVAHDPTQLNRQGPDIGPHYRSAIFPGNAEQAKIAKAYIAQLDKARSYGAAIVTTIESDQPFYPAEGYHQDFMTKNPSHPYIVFHDLPKIKNLKQLFPQRFRDKPTLVSDARSTD